MEQNDDTTQTKPSATPAPTTLKKPLTAKTSTTLHSSKRSNRVPFFATIGIVAALLAGYAGASMQSYIEDEGSVLTVLNNAADDGNNAVTPNEESIAAVAKAVSPSVVSIVTSTTQTSRLYNGQYAVEGAGTGMIVSSNGYIMTNKHVVDGADTVTVVLPDGRTYDDVQVLGSDPLNDVAFLKISDVSGLPAITLGDSKTVRIGQTVIAIGNALGQYQNSVTSGIISGTGRPVVASSDGTADGNPESLTDLIQTDAAINSGNSGGPLLNL
jgi:serine protease Do